VSVDVKRSLTMEDVIVKKLLTTHFTVSFAR